MVDYWFESILLVHWVDGWYTFIMEKGFFSPKGRRSGKGVKEKQTSMVDDSGTGDIRVNEATYISVNANTKLDQNSCTNP